MDSNTINIPASVDDMRIKHLSFVLKLREFIGSEPGHGDICKMTAQFTGIDYVKMKRYSPSTVRNLFMQISQVFVKYTPKELPLSIEYPNDQGKLIKYNLIYDFSKLPYEWFIDENAIDFYENPIDLMSMVYIEDGFTYGDADEFDNVINPRSVRNKIFTEHAPLSLYLDIQAFFLANWNVFQKSSEVEALRRKRKRK